jgi:recombination protein RecT
MHDPDQTPKDDTNQGSLLESKPQESKPAPMAEVKPESAVVTHQPASVTDRITSIDVAQKMVLKYASKLVQDDRAQQFYTQVMLMMRNNPVLAKCDAQSVFTAMMACVHLDLMPNTPEGYAYIIPYGQQAQFQLGYKGLCELAYRSGVIKYINAELVFPQDSFEVELGTERTMTHKPNYAVDRTDYNKCNFVYATAKLSNGETVFEVMNKQDVERTRKTSKAGMSGPWKDWPDQMAKKTVVKRLLKLLPSSNADNRFKLAAEWDSTIEGGKNLKVDRETGEIIDGELVGVSDMTAEAIENATSKEQLQQILTSLSPAERKKAASLVAERAKAL